MLYGWVVYLHRCHLRHLPRRRAPRSTRTPKVSPLENSTYHAGRQAVRKTESSQYRTPHIERHIMQGSTARVEKLQDRPQGDGVDNTVYIERLNVTFRARPSSLARRGRGLARQTCMLRHGIYLIETVYKFCTRHASLRLTKMAAGDACIQQIAAMAARITDHCWNVRKLASFHIPPPYWTSPKGHGLPRYTRIVHCNYRRISGYAWIASSSPPSQCMTGAMPDSAGSH
jgi:hypothetical protein